MLFLAGLFCLGAVPASFAQEPVVLTLTTNVTVQDVSRFGINISDSYYDAPVLKYRTQKNYEGMVYRQMVKGILYTNGLLAYDGDTNTIVGNGWAESYTNGSVFELVSGPSRGLTGQIVSVSTRFTDVWNNGNPFYAMFYEFNTPVNLGTNASVRDMGIRIENLNRTGEGYIGNNAYRLVNITAAADNPPGVYGVSCAQMNATNGSSILRYDTFWTNLAAVSGNWNLNFWIRKVSGNPGVKVSPDSMSGETFTTNFVPTTNWQKMQLVMPLNNAAAVKIETTGGVVRVDNVELWKAGYTNPTAFTDDFVDYMKRLQPGTLRLLKMGGNTVSNWIYDPISRQAGRFNMWSSTGPYDGDDDPATGFHSLIGLCDYLGAEPWLCIPGCVKPSEVVLLMDYLAGPTNTAGGSIRAGLGRIQPWTDTVKHIHVEFGNEAWNTYGPYAYGGYNGADFWRELIAAGKSSPSYNTNILFHTAGQNFSASMAADILGDATNSDRYAIAPYMIQNINAGTWSFTAGDYAAQFKWFMGYPLYQIFEAGMAAQSNVMHQTGVEYSTYEFNYHAVTVSPTDTLSQVNVFLPSICHGLSTANSMLAMLKRYKMRTQNFFTLCQESYQGALLWGNTLSFKKGEERSRPAFLAEEMVNRALHGNLVQASFSTNPQFPAYGVFNISPETRSYDTLYSYAFRDGTTNRLVLFNYDLTATQTVRMALTDYVKNSTANQWILSAPAYTNNNEKNLAAPQVVPSTGTVAFTSGTEIALAPFSMQVLEWEADGILPQPVVSTNSLTVPEGGTAGFTVTLFSPPQSAVTVSVAWVSGDTDITVQSGATLIFDSGNWSAPQPVVLAAAEDADTQNGIAIIRCSSPGMNPVDVTATEAENDLGIIVSTNAVGVPENSTAAFQIKLSKDPGGSLTVSVARTSGDTDITVQSGTALMFNSGNWATWQTVTLAAAEDPDVVNGTANIACTASGLSTQNVTATEIDNDTVNLIVTPRFIRVPESGTAAFTVRMSAIPPENSTVLVARVSGDSDLTVLSGATLMFGSSNWNANQTVTLSAAADADSLNGDALFRCQPQFPNTTGPKDVVALETDSGSTAVSFRDGVNGYTGTSDSYLSSYSKNSNYGTAGTGYIEYTRPSVIAWNLTSLGSTTTVRSADITLAIAQASGTYITNSFNLTVYALKRPWVEGNGSTGVTWNTTDGATPWQIAGAKGANDRGALVGTVRIPEPLNATTQELVIVNLNAAGVAYIQACITNPAANFGFIFDNEENYQRRFCYLSEYGTVSSRPRLTVYYAGFTNDRDGDGLPDWWETLYFGGPTNANPSATAANGINTVLECYIAGLDPTNPNAAFLTSIRRPPSSEAVLRWNGVSGRVYKIYWTSNLLSSFQTLQTNVPWTGSVFTDAVHGAERQGFYRIEVKLQP